ncbi:MAG: hypothetical protein WCJ09_27755, partial [Planctomycetota bacterium]
EKFASDPEIGKMETAHPFDSHPPLSQRLSAVGIELDENVARSLLTSKGDGGWYRIIPNAEELECQQWQAYEDRFRQYHEQSLPYRFLPSTPEEQAVVERAFPQISFEGKEGIFAFDFEKIHYTTWITPIRFSELVSCVNNEGTLVFEYKRTVADKKTVKLSDFTKDVQAQVLDAFGGYYGRYLAADQYQKELAAANAAVEQAGNESAK